MLSNLGHVENDGGLRGGRGLDLCTGRRLHDYLRHDLLFDNLLVYEEGNATETDLTLRFVVAEKYVGDGQGWPLEGSVSSEEATVTSTLTSNHVVGGEHDHLLRVDRPQVVFVLSVRVSPPSSTASPPFDVVSPLWQFPSAWLLLRVAQLTW